MLNNSSALSFSLSHPLAATCPQFMVYPTYTLLPVVVGLPVAAYALKVRHAAEKNKKIIYSRVSQPFTVLCVVRSAIPAVT